MNAIGISEFSEAGSGKTPAVLRARSPESLEMKAALECREAWTEVGNSSGAVQCTLRTHPLIQPSNSR